MTEEKAVEQFTPFYKECSEQVKNYDLGKYFRFASYLKTEQNPFEISCR